ncbi:MAG: DUF86 domain-containing protein [Candidatus Aminicenantes bacterium]|nr:DUF86 domain-containing protein [Candidatus Aminicenantes bacterium]
MVISKLNLNKIQENLNLIGEFLEKLKRLSKLEQNEFYSDERNPAATESFLRRCIEAIFDVGRHILSKSFSFKSLEYKEVAKELGEKGIVSEEYSKILIKMAGYRNRMVHFYKDIMAQELYDILQNELTDIEKFLKEVEIFLKKYKNQT